MAEPSLIGVIDTYGIELIHPRRDGRSKRQIGRKGISNQRWIVGGKRCLLHNHLGLIVNWDCDTANVYDGTAFQHLVDGVSDQMVVFADEGFAKVEASSNLRLCRRGEWNSRMLIETILSMLTLDFKKVMHRRWSYFKTRVGFTMALFNLLVQWMVCRLKMMALSLYQSLDSGSKLAPLVTIGIHYRAHYPFT